MYIIMKNYSISLRIYFSLVIVLAMLSAAGLFLPQGSFMPVQEFPAPKWVIALINFAALLIIYGGLGYIGFRLDYKLGFAEIWDPLVANRRRLIFPAIIGAGLGIFFILCDVIISRYNPLGPFPHPPFPTSVVASATAGIGEEIIFRLLSRPSDLNLLAYSQMIISR